MKSNCVNIVFFSKGYLKWRLFVTKTLSEIRKPYSQETFLL